MIEVTTISTGFSWTVPYWVTRLVFPRYWIFILAQIMVKPGSVAWYQKKTCTLCIKSITVYLTHALTPFKLNLCKQITVRKPSRYITNQPGQVNLWSHSAAPQLWDNGFSQKPIYTRTFNLLTFVKCGHKIVQKRSDGGGGKLQVAPCEVSKNLRCKESRNRPTYRCACIERSSPHNAARTHRRTTVLQYSMQCHTTKT